MSVDVRVVDDDQLDADWAVGLCADGRRVLFARASARPNEVAAGYAAALRQCPVRIAIEAA